MKKSQVLPSLLAVALCGCKASSNPATTSNPSTPPPTQQAQSTPAPTPPEPKYGWKVFHAETFEMHTLEGKAFRVPASIKKLRVKIKADSGVLGGTLPAAVLTALAQDHKILTPRSFLNKPCSLLDVDQIDTTCEIDPGGQMDFVVRDERGAGTFLLGEAGLLIRDHKVLEQATSPNRIQISLSGWQCIENCKSLDREVKEIYGLKQ